jgi:hypothetical protein
MMRTPKNTNWRSLYLALSMTMWGFGISYWAYVYFRWPLWVVPLLAGGVGAITYFLPTWGLGITNAIASIFVFIYYPVLPAMYIPAIAHEVTKYYYLSSIAVIATAVIVIDVAALLFIYADKYNWRLGLVASTASLSAFVNPMLSALMLLYASTVASPAIVAFLVVIILIAFIGVYPFGYLTPYQPGWSLVPVLYANAWVYVLLLLIALVLTLHAFQMAEEKRDIKKAKYMYYASVALAVAAGTVLVDRYEWLALTSAPMLMLLLDNVSQIEFAYKQTALETYREAKLPIGSFVDWDILKNEGEMILGYDDVKEDMRKTAEEFVRAMSKGRTWGHAVLFTGPPGTGKTALAHYFAYLVYEEGKKAGIEFKAVRVEARDLLTAYWGETERRINELFAWAAMNNGIIIMDEVERIAWARTQYVSDDYTPKVVATLGDALDNPLVRDKPFLLIMTTNMPQLIDAMFKRPGRIFRVFYIGEMDDVRKEAVIRAFEERYGITLSPKERRELKELIIVGDDARFYFECRRNDSPHERCMNYIKSVVETRKQTQQTPIVL